MKNNNCDDLFYDSLVLGPHYFNNKEKKLLKKFDVTLKSLTFFQLWFLMNIYLPSEHRKKDCRRLSFGVLDCFWSSDDVRKIFRKTSPVLGKRVLIFLVQYRAMPFITQQAYGWPIDLYLCKALSCIRGKQYWCSTATSWPIDGAFRGGKKTKI